MSYTLYELNEYIRQVLALNLSEPMWIRCELAQVKRSRGHCYLDLVQKGEQGDEVIAQSQAVIWTIQLQTLQKKLGLELDAILQEGMEVLLLAKVEFHERFGLKLLVLDIDPGYTLGQLALKRRETILKLKKEGLLEKNKNVDLPAVIQRIAILSSESAAGLKDFLNEMSHNEFGYIFQFNLFPVAMQGSKVTDEILASLKKIKAEEFDALVIIRGGGSKLDLVAFDEYVLCKNLAHAPLPIICGIGHEVDETVLDRVVHTSLKTPTAVAGFIIHHNMHFESQVIQLGHEIKNNTQELIQEQYQFVNQLSSMANQHVFNHIQRQQMMLDYIKNELPNLFKNKLKLAAFKLELLNKSAKFLDPILTLKRGFTITMKNGKPITNKSRLKAGDELETVFYKKKIKSVLK